CRVHAAVAAAAAGDPRCDGLVHVCRDDSEVGANAVDCDQVASSISPASTALRNDGRRPRHCSGPNQVSRTAGVSRRCASLPGHYTLADDWKLRIASASLSWVSNTVSSLVMASRSVIRFVRLRSLRLPPWRLTVVKVRTISPKPALSM